MARRLTNEYRLTKEYNDIQTNPPLGYSCVDLINGDIFHWDITILCDKEDSPHNGGRFHVEVQFPSDYPFKPPQLRITTKIFHPQLWKSDDYRALCMDILGSNWSPALTASSILHRHISPMLHEPFSSYTECRCCGSIIDEADANAHRRNVNPTGATGLYFDDRNRYNAMAREWTLMYAMIDNENSICIRLLSEWRLSQYKQTLIDEKGYDDVQDWKYLTEQQLIHDMEFKEGHARRFVRNTNAYFEAETQPNNNQAARPVINALPN
eukprot:681218_1